MMRDRTDFFELASLITEAYCIEHNLPCKRRHTHEELADAVVEVRAAHLALYGLSQHELRPAVLEDERHLK